MKKFLLLICLLLITGCDVTYNLTVTDNSVMESSDFVYKKSNDNKKIVQDYYKGKYVSYYDMDLKTDNYYSKKKIDTLNKIGMNLSYNYKNEKYQNSSLFDQCYYKKSFIKGKKYIIIKTEGGARCFNKDNDELIDSLTINITSKLKAVKNNADKVKGDTYIWKLTQDNYNSKDIFIKFKRDDSNNVLLILLFAFVIIGFISIVIMGYIAIKNKKNNEL